MESLIIAAQGDVGESGEVFGCEQQAPRLGKRKSRVSRTEGGSINQGQRVTWLQVGGGLLALKQEAPGGDAFSRHRQEAAPDQRAREMGQGDEITACTKRAD